MTLAMIGLGLDGPKDISLKALEVVKSCNHIFLERYTSMLNCTISDLESLYGKKIIVADRDLVESKAETILDRAKTEKVAFLVVGDVFSATTHTDLFLRAKEAGITIQVINNTSIMTAIGITGLELYKFGKTTSLPFFEKNFRPETPYDVLKMNKEMGLHTLILLDIKKDQERYMDVGTAIKQMFAIEESRGEKVFTKDLQVVGCARLGSESAVIKSGKAGKILKKDFGKPLHCLIVPGKLHFIEEDMLRLWSVDE